MLRKRTLDPKKSYGGVERGGKKPRNKVPYRVRAPLKSVTNEPTRMGTTAASKNSMKVSSTVDDDVAGSIDEASSDVSSVVIDKEKSARALALIMSPIVQSGDDEDDDDEDEDDNGNNNENLPPIKLQPSSKFAASPKNVLSAGANSPSSRSRSRRRKSAYRTRSDALRANTPKKIKKPTTTPTQLGDDKVNNANMELGSDEGSLDLEIDAVALDSGSDGRKSSGPTAAASATVDKIRSFSSSRPTAKPSAAAGEEIANANQRSTLRGRGKRKRKVQEKASKKKDSNPEEEKSASKKSFKGKSLLSKVVIKKPSKESKRKTTAKSTARSPSRPKRKRSEPASSGRGEGGNRGGSSSDDDRSQDEDGNWKFVEPTEQELEQRRQLTAKKSQPAPPSKLKSTSLRLKPRRVDLSKPSLLKPVEEEESGCGASGSPSSRVTSDENYSGRKLKGGAATPIALSEERSSPALPPGWTSRVSKTHNRIFFYHEKFGSSWVRPISGAATTPKATEDETAKDRDDRKVKVAGKVSEPSRVYDPSASSNLSFSSLSSSSVSSSSCSFGRGSAKAVSPDKAKSEAKVVKRGRTIRRKRMSVEVGGKRKRSKVSSGGARLVGGGGGGGKRGAVRKSSAGASDSSVFEFSGSKALAGSPTYADMVREKIEREKRIVFRRVVGVTRVGRDGGKRVRCGQGTIIGCALQFLEVY